MKWISLIAAIALLIANTSKLGYLTFGFPSAIAGQTELGKLVNPNTTLLKPPTRRGEGRRK